MKIQVVGEGAAADTLRRHLAELGYRVVNKAAAYVIHLAEHEAPGIAVRGAVGAFGEQARECVEELARIPVAWEECPLAKEVHVAFHADYADAAMRGILRAVLRATGHGKKRSWVQKLLGRTK